MILNLNMAISILFMCTKSPHPKQSSQVFPPSIPGAAGASAQVVLLANFAYLEGLRGDEDGHAVGHVETGGGLALHPTQPHL